MIEEPSKTPAVHLVDATGYLFRAYHAIRGIEAPDGTPVSAVYGLVQTLLKHQREARPAYIASVFDASMESFRNELDPTYKANRGAPPPDLVPQFDLATQAVDALGFHAVEREGYEADDVIATLAGRARAAGHPVVIASFDKDLAQLVGEGVTLLDLGRGEVIDAAGVEARYGVPPSLIADFLALRGDAIDNVAGIRGIGPKTAAALLRHFGSLEAILEAPERIAEIEIRGRETLVAKIREGAETARRSRRLTGLEGDVPLDLAIEDLGYRGPDPSRALLVLERLGFRRLAEALRTGSLFSAAGSR